MLLAPLGPSAIFWLISIWFNPWWYSRWCKLLQESNWEIWQLIVHLIECQVFNSKSPNILRICWPQLHSFLYADVICGCLRPRLSKKATRPIIQSWLAVGRPPLRAFHLVITTRGRSKKNHGRARLNLPPPLSRIPKKWVDFVEDTLPFYLQRSTQVYGS